MPLLQPQQLHIRNTRLRLKLSPMLQKWNIYVTYWNRILRGSKVAPMFDTSSRCPSGRQAG